MSARAPASKRGTVQLGFHCDNRCVFCAQRGVTLAPPDVSSQLRAAKASGLTELTFVGGEPTLDPALPAALAEAKALGFEGLGLQTNARRLAEPGFLATLVAAGLGDVHLTVLGADAAVHDYHTGVAGSFAQLAAGVEALRASGLPFVATTVVTRSTFRSLQPIAAWLQARGARAWHLCVVTNAGAAAHAFDRVVPRLGMALPFALQALDAARKAGLPAFVSGAPLCALGPFARWSLDAPARAYGATCERCAARAACPGVDARYLQRYGEEELHAPSELPARETDALARLFVGLGHLEAVAVADVPPPPAKLREGLKELGKVKPAEAEVDRGAPKKSGEALKEIFPALFGGPEKPPVKPG